MFFTVTPSDLQLLYVILRTFLSFCGDFVINCAAVPFLWVLQGTNPYFK